MKKSRIAKLALLGASAAALAATLSTSTYAWYVSNKTANVTTSTGSTAAAAADGSILLSTTGAYGEFYKSISLGNYTHTAQNGYGLQPVQSTTGTTFTDLDGTAVTPVALTGSNVATDSKVYKYTFYILSPFAAVNTVTPTITITNTTTSIPTQVCLLNGHAWNTSTSISNNQRFTSNALNALVFSGTSTASTATYAEGYSFTAATSSTTLGIQPLSTNLTTTALTVGTIFKTINNTSWEKDDTTYDCLTTGAHTYYDAIAEVDLTTAQKTRATTSAFSTFSLAAATPVRLDYYLYLDGASEACYNACAGQGISVTFSFTAS